MNEQAMTANEVAKDFMKKFSGLRLKSFLGSAGLLKLGLTILIGLVMSTGRAQTNFANAQMISGDWGSVVNTNTGITPDTFAPNIAGFSPSHPLWYQWTASHDGEVELDTVGSIAAVTNIVTIGYDTNFAPIVVTNVDLVNMDTVLGVYQGTSPKFLNQIAANDDLYPVNSSLTVETVSPLAEGVIPQVAFSVILYPPETIGLIQPYYGPSHLRFTAKGGQTYYFAVDTKFRTGPVSLNWAYKSSGVFRFASEDFDWVTGLPLYQTAETESQTPLGSGNVDVDSVETTYYNYNAPGVLVTVTRSAGSIGRAVVDYQTEDGTSLPGLSPSDQPGIAGVDYTPILNGQLVFDDFEMSKTILIPIIYKGSPGPPGDQTNRVFGIKLIDDGGLTSPQLDEFEDNSSVSPPRVDPIFGTAVVKILNTEADPWGPEYVQMVVTNIIPNVSTNVMTNIVLAAYPTNLIFNFEKANYRVPADVDDSAISPYNYATVTLYVKRGGTNTATTTINYKVDAQLNDDSDIKEGNDQFPLQPGSDYAVPLAANQNTVIRNYATTNYDRVSTNYDFDVADGTLTFPATPASQNRVQPLHIRIPVSKATKFNKDFRIQLYREVKVGNDNVPRITGMNAETTVTVLFNDENPPAGSVDETYNADFNTELALLPSRIPSTTPGDNSNPGVGSPLFAGQVYAVADWTNDEALIGGDFSTYNGTSMNGVALIQTNGQLDLSFNPGSGVSGDVAQQGNDARVNAAVISGNQFYLGGNFTAYNSTLVSGVARVNANGTLDTSFNIGTGADGVVRAIAVQTDGKVLIGGDFTHINGVPRNYIARLNTNGSVDATFDPTNILTGPVYSLALSPSVLLNLNRTASGNMNEDDQAINLGSLTSGTLTVNYNMFADPDDMRIYYGDTNVIAGTGVLIYDTGLVSGTSTIILPFGPTNGITTNLITIVMNQGGANHNTTWNYTASIGAAQSSSGILVGGGFNVTGQVYANIARLNTNGTLDVSFNPGTGPNGIVHALGWQLNDQIVAGGEFSTVNGLSYNHIARFNTDGSVDTTNFFVGAGADDVVYNLTLQQLDGTIYAGGAFSLFNGTHRRGFTRLYSNGTVDTTFMDTAYNQFAGLKRIYSYDSPAVFASAVQGNGGVLIGGSFLQVGGGQANPDVCNALDYELGYVPSFGDGNLWVEPKTRDGVRNRTGFARLIGGSTVGPGNIGLNQTSYSQNKSISSLTVALVRTNGTLGPASANFSVQPGLALAGQDYRYQSAPPLYWVAWAYLNLPSRMREDGLWGVSGNALLIDALGVSLSQADTSVNNLAKTTVSVIANQLNPGNLNAQFQLANPSLDTFYLGGEEIPLGTALGVSSAPFNLIDDTTYPGQFGFISSSYVATNLSPAITLVRSNGTFGIVSMRYWATNGTAIAGADYKGITNQPLVFNTSVITTNFTVTILNNGFITNVEKTVNMRLGNLGTTPNATFGISNAVLRIINPNFQGYVTLGASNFTGTASSGVLNFVVNRVSGSLGTVTVQYGTTNGPSATNGVDFTGSTNMLTWNSGDVSPRTVSIPLLPTQTVGGSKQFGVKLFNPTNNGVSAPSIMGVLSNAMLTISNDNSYGALQFSSPIYLVNEATNNYALLTVIRTGGLVGTDTVQFATSDGLNTGSGNYYATNGPLTFLPGQVAQSFRVYVKPDGVPDPAPTNFYFNVTLSNVVNAAFGSPTNAQVRILDAESYNQPPGSPDPGFNSDGMNGDVFALSLNSSAQILAGGNFTAVGTTARGRIARLNTDGTLDSGFLNGLDGANAAVNALVCQTTLSDADRVLVGGAFTTIDDQNRYFIARLMNDGTLDTSFNPGGGADNVVNALAETFFANGTNLARKIYVGGAFASFNGNHSPGVERLNNDGTVDYGFNVGSGADGSVYAVAVYPTNSIYWGKVLVGGSFAHFNGVANNNLVRLNSDGSLDTTFNSNLGFDTNGIVHALAVQVDGSILVGGSFTNFNGTPLNDIAHLNSGGSLDTGFVADTAGGANGTVEAIVLQPDNRIVVAGQFTQFNGVTRNHITRLLPTGATDPTINFGIGANGDIDTLLVQPADGMIVIGGAFSKYDGQTHNKIARIYGGAVTGSGAFEFTSANYQVDENGILAAITILRTGGTDGTNSDGSGDVFVHFATSDGTAANGTNYFAVSTNVDFPPGEVLETVLVPVLDDSVITPNLTVNLALSSPTPPAILGNQPTATLTIVNDDNAVNFSSAFYTQVKNTPTGLALVDILRVGGTNGTCSVDFYTTTNGSTAVIGTDYYATNGTVTFNPGDSDVQVQVPVINNGLAEGNKTVGLLLTNAVNTLLASPSNATLTIIDTVSAPGQLYFGATSFTAASGDGSGYLTVLRTNGSSGSVSVTYNLVAGTAQPGIDYVDNSPGTVTFGNGETQKSIVVPLINNNAVRGTVSLSVVLVNPPTGGATLTAPTNATLTIVNTNIGFAFLNATNYVRETNGLVPIFVQRLGGTNGGVTVDYSTTNNGTAQIGVNYNPVSGTLTFAENEVLKAISLPLIYNPGVTGDLTLGMRLTNPSSGTSLVAPSNAVVVVQDADAGLSFTNSAMSVPKNMNNAVITVVCSNPSVEPVLVDTNVIPLSVNYATSDGTAMNGVDYVGVTGTLIFTNGIGTNTFNVPILNNSLVQGDHTFNVSLSSPTPPGQLVFPSNQVVTIVDHNSGLSFSSPTYTVLKTGVAAVITVLRTDFTDTVSSVNFATSDGTASAGLDYTATNGVLVFTNGETSKTFSVRVIANTAVQPDKTVLLQLSNATNGFLIAPYAATLTIHDTSGSLVVPAGSTLVSESFAPPNGIIDPGENVSLLFALRASGGTNIPNVLATLLVTNGITSPSPSTAVSYGALTVGGAPVSRQFSFTANGTNSQQIAATFLLNNGVTNIGTAVFTYTLGTWTNTYYNTNAIIINDDTIASPYPSIITVTNVGGTVVKTVLMLTNVYHTSPQDIGVLLVSPAQLDTLIMAGAGGQVHMTRVTVFFDDAATNTLPPSDTIPQIGITNSTYKPMGYPPTPFFP
jgi:uncharacterized delta-60 repeat protein